MAIFGGAPDFEGGSNIYTCINTYTSTVSNQNSYTGFIFPNGATNPVGDVYVLPQGAQQNSTTAGANTLSGGNGYGAPLVIRYVRYNSTANAALTALPSVVYWADETFTTVTGTYSESVAGSSTAAGILCINTANYPGSLTGAQLATALNGNYCFIVTKGFVPGVSVPASTAVGDILVGAASSAFTMARVAAGTAPTYARNAIALTAVANSKADILANFENTL